MVNFNVCMYVRLPALENHVFDERFSAISYKSHQIIANFVLNFPTFSLPWQ